jgi:hypothetical protein
MEKKSPVFLKVLPWLLTPTICMYIIISFYDFSLTSFVTYFKEIKQFRLFLLFSEVIFAIFLTRYYKLKQK